jgi:hypothetical protein
MRKAILIVCLVGVLAAASAINQSSAAAPALSGKMTQLQYLVGTWTCQTKLPAMGNEPAGTHQGSISFEVEPSNTVSYDVSAPEYSAAGFIGYQQAKKLWWNSGADNFGGVTFESGTSESGDVMTGMTFWGGKHVASRDTITKTSNTKYEDLYQVQKNGKWTLGADSNCTKTSNTPG